ncbi:cytochrome P450 [Irpex lacteus]|nr:cytochrome P450 [Irpex lacteus]
MDLRETLKQIHNWPGYRALFTARFFISALVGSPRSIKYIYREMFWVWKNKYSDFEEHGVDIISGITILPRLRMALYVADPAAIKEITAHRARFPKPVQQYKAISFYGENIVASEGEQWKRFRKISAPAFSERNNRMVWEETVRIVLDLFDNVWGQKEEIIVDHAVEITLPIALFVIGVAGFGQRMPWTNEEVIPAGHQMGFKEALHILSTDIVFKLVAPQWLLTHGPERLRRVGIAYDEIEAYMTELIQERKAANSKEERYDLFSSLLDANDEDAEVTLTHSELLGNIFIFLLAGHETTAHTLCFTFGMLALYQDEQDKLYEHIKSVIPDGSIPSYETMNHLTQSMAVFYETLRLFPPVVSIPKYAAEDTSLPTKNRAGETIFVPVPAGTPISLHTPGLHYNPRYWEDPHAFKPDRFLGEWPRDAFLPFSSGARSCLGRRFFETEGIAILTLLVSRYKIEVKEEPQFAHETFDERKERVLRAKPGLTLTPVRVPLVFKRRT